MKESMIFSYGMTNRHYSPKAVPLRGLIDRMKDHTGKFYDILFYDRRLDAEEVKGFGLQFLGAEESNEYDA